jgi:hypothetical protein
LLLRGRQLLLQLLHCFVSCERHQLLLLQLVCCCKLLLQLHNHAFS